ncbi:hypothetical protein M5689_006482 [Euphorbia peplus]|nr:hypothetical protein M5689_006482 [Euphorbia peplus]
MSASFDLSFICQQLWLFSSSSSSTRPRFASIFALFLLCWILQQRFNLGLPSFSMRLRPIRTCSGVECFGGFHIKRFFYLFLFFRGALT